MGIEPFYSEFRIYILAMSILPLILVERSDQQLLMITAIRCIGLALKKAHHFYLANAQFQDQLEIDLANRYGGDRIEDILN